jgi:hypothetical protein
VISRQIAHDKRCSGTFLKIYELMPLFQDEV